MECDEIYCSKVFTKSKEPYWLSLITVPIYRGGTGYNLFNAPSLDYEIEHSKPDYDLYESYANSSLKKGKLDAYLKASIGFTTRGCFRRCQFCVNRNKTHVEKWSPVSEFYDPKRPYIFMLDDNVFGCKQWREIFDELEATKKRISYRQGLDLRLVDAEKAKALERVKYYLDVSFSFDNIKDLSIIEKHSRIYREYCSKETQVFLLTGFYKNGLDEIEDCITRINVLKQFKFFPFVMKHENYLKSKYAPIYVQIARYCNQRFFYKSQCQLIDYIVEYGSKDSKILVKNDNELRKVLSKLSV